MVIAASRGSGLPRSAGVAGAVPNPFVILPALERESPLDDGVAIVIRSDARPGKVRGVEGGVRLPSRLTEP